jgi:exonuclease III
LDNITFKQLLRGRYKERIYIEANGSAGGILIISWKHTNYTAQVKMDGSIIRITSVYGPSSGNNNEDFLQQIRQTQSSSNIPLMLCGDFNLILKPEETSIYIIWTSDKAFQNLMHELALIDLSLQERKYTWSRAHTILARLDRFLISQAWNVTLLACIQKTLPNTKSDHCPVMCSCEMNFPVSNLFRFQNFFVKPT